MIIDHEHKVLIGTPAKTGCTSLEFSIRYRDDVPKGLDIFRWESGKRPHAMVIPGQHRNYKRYMTVRHPLDRLVSLYYHHTKSWQQGKEWREGRDFFSMEPSFNEFLLWWLEEREMFGLRYNAELPHLATVTPSWWLPPNIWMVTLGQCHASFDPQYYIRLESYQNDLERINPYWARVPHRMSAGADTDWRLHFTKRKVLDKIMEDHAESDMELLGYDA